METCTAHDQAGARRAWGLLALAVAAEIVGALALRASAGFTRLPPSLAAVLAFGVALVVVSRVMKVLPVSVAYPVWAGGGTAGVALLGMGVLGEATSAARLAGVTLIVFGVVLINRDRRVAGGC